MKYIMKEETREDVEDDFIFSIGFTIARDFKISERGMEAVKGFIISKLDSVKTRLIKYYGLRWYDFVHEKTAMALAIRGFIRDVLKNGISEIASEYAVLPEQPAEKANYVTGKPKNESMDLNSGEFGEPE